jgi:putative flippase GtrA
MSLFDLIHKLLEMKFIRFCIVGAISFLINAALTLLFLQFPLDILIATIIALIITQIIQYFMTKYLTFRYLDQIKPLSFFNYFGSRIVTILIIAIATDIGVKNYNIPWFFAQLIGVFISMVLNYLINDRFIFVKATDEERAILQKRQKILFYCLAIFLLGLLILRFFYSYSIVSI